MTSWPESTALNMAPPSLHLVHLSEALERRRLECSVIWIHTATYTRDEPSSGYSYSFCLWLLQPFD